MQRTSPSVCPREVEGPFHLACSSAAALGGVLGVLSWGRLVPRRPGSLQPRGPGAPLRPAIQRPSLPRAPSVCPGPSHSLGTSAMMQKVPLVFPVSLMTGPPGRTWHTGCPSGARGALILALRDVASEAGRMVSASVRAQSQAAACRRCRPGSPTSQPRPSVPGATLLPCGGAGSLHPEGRRY